MPSVLDEIREVFGEENFYAILNIAKTASKNESMTSFVFITSPYFNSVGYAVYGILSKTFVSPISVNISESSGIIHVRSGRTWNTVANMKNGSRYLTKPRQALVPNIIVAQENRAEVSFGDKLS